MSKQSWNYRVVKRLENGEWTYSIHETYYSAQKKEEAITESPVQVSAETLADLRWVLERMLQALDKPLLNYDDF